MAGSDKQVVAYLGMLPFLAEIRELVTAIRIQARVGGTLWDRALHPPLPSLMPSRLRTAAT